jgi:riboflavin biosynthesis pyrimidine reductase
VGAGTVRADDPRLTVRLEGLEMPGQGGPDPVVLSASLDLAPDINLLQRADSGGAPVRIYTLEATGSSRLPGARIVPIREDSDGELDLEAVLDDLGRIGIRSVLVEGGAGTFTGFLRRELVDRWALFKAPVVLGNDGGTPLVALPASPSPGEGWWMDNHRDLPLDKDRLNLATPVR